MEKFNGGMCRNQLWCIIFATFIFSFFLFYLDSSTLFISKNVQSINDYIHSVTTIDKNRCESVEKKPELDCSGKYIFVHELPGKFNVDLLKKCETISSWANMCRSLSNRGLGPDIENSQGVLPKEGWFRTGQFSLSVIFHNRMKQYKCLTNNSSLASAIYVPYYAGLDVSRYLWGFNTSMRDSTSKSLVKWLRSRPEWQVLGGRDHFLVAGRITWDFRRAGNNDSHWGGNLLILPEIKNMTTLLIESNPWHDNDVAIPYPTYFHPQTDDEVFQWQNTMRRQKKKYLLSFVGGPRPKKVTSIRGLIIDQCSSSGGKCKLVNCHEEKRICYSPTDVMQIFQSSVFCLQPPGDSSTRRSTFDSILAGCIPVFFHPASAYVQYTWHLPRNYTKYSVFISEDDLNKGKVNIISTLDQISDEDVRAMREEVIKLIPKVIYADPRVRTGTITEDAFDISLKGVIQRVNNVRKQMKEGKDSNVSFDEENSWREEHEWDHFFPQINKKSANT